MKKINHILLGIIALLGFAPLTFAQGQYSIAKQIGALTYGDNDPYTTGNYTIEKNVGFSKVISEPQSDGTYWIKLEAFATGSSVVSSEPADIVLVLDYSTSMNYHYGSTGYYYQLVTANNGFAYSNTFWTATQETDQRFYKIGDTYYRVQRGQQATGETNPYGAAIYYNYLYIDANGKRYYLDDMQLVTEMPTKYTSQNNNAPIWNGALFQYRQFTNTQNGLTDNQNRYTRLRALRTAVYDFIDVIYHNDIYEDDTFDKPRPTPLRNRVSIVVFNGANNNTHTRILQGWTYVTNDNGSRDESLIKAVTNATAENYTHSERGMTYANTLLGGIGSDRESSRTVVLFTDGVPGENVVWNNSSPGVANSCIQQANIAKRTYDATVFTVALWDGSWTDSQGQNMKNYLDYTSSNWFGDPNQTNGMQNPGVPSTDESVPEKNRKKELIYQKDAGDDLSAVFVEIAKQSGGDSNLSQSSSAVDIVSSSFVVEKTEDKQVLVFTAKCATADPDNNHYTFLEETLIDHSTYTYNTYDDEGNVLEEDLDVDANIRVVPDDSDPNKITVVGFDYSNNWCGPKTDAAGNTEIMGHKIIIMIPVKMNPDAVGGPNVATNLPGSGIYANETHAADEKPIIEFDIPRVSLPVNIYVEKAGLRPGESAKFRIDRAKLPTGEQGTDWNVEDIAEKDWHYVSTVFVTNSPNSKVSDKTGNPMTKVRGMPANGYNWDEDGNYTTEKVNYIYRIVEEEWSWSYTPLTGPQYTVTDNVDNPFTFENQLRDNIDITVRHAESKVSNHFRPKTEGSTVGDVKTDDSKKNNRTSSSSSSSSEEGATE